MKFGLYLQQTQVPEWRARYVRYTLLKKKIYSLGSALTEEEKQLRSAAPRSIGRPSDTISTSRRHSIQPDSEFWTIIYEDLEMIQEFYASKREQALAHMAQLRRQVVALHEVQQHAAAAAAAALRNERSQSPNYSPRSISPQPYTTAEGKDLDALSDDNVDVAHPQSPDPETPHFETSTLSRGGVRQKTLKTLIHHLAAPLIPAKPVVDKVVMRKLRLAFKEFYRACDMLSSYQHLNQTAFLKILKKYDKVTLSSAKTQFSEFLQTKDWVKDDTMAKLMSEVENIYTQSLMNGDRHQAMRHLRIPVIKDHHARQTLLVGFFSGIITMASIMFIVASTYADTIAFEDVIPALIMFRGLLVPLLLLTFVGINAYIWKRTRVNFVFIFELDKRKHADHWTLWLLSLLCSLATLAFMMVYFMVNVIDSPISASWPPTMAYIVVGAFFFNPFPFLYRSQRFWLIQELARVLSAPFIFVIFPDFWLADQLNSLIIPIQDIEFAICYWVKGFPTDYNTCLTNGNGIRILVSCIPAWARFWQCIRRFHDTKDRMHLLNAVKYVLALIVIIFGGLDQFSRESANSYNHFSTVWIVFAVISTLYAFFWDIFMDWGLGQKGAHELFLRRGDLIYPKLLYYWAIISNLALRFSWSFSIAPQSLNIGLSPQVLKSILAFLEIFRRFQWNFFRLENEHVNNCGKFRAMKEIPLPFIVEMPQDAGVAAQDFVDHEDVKKDE